jgi:hypothetical protein
VSHYNSQLLSLFLYKRQEDVLMSPTGLRLRKTALAMDRTENYRPDLSSDRAPDVNKLVTVYK